ncbi:MAG: NADH-quinone oxidoreductase subunit C [Catonella sp.]|jgi:ech hydrogenase subunit D|nr:NADH-quinone oxidoreductase subunit C [Catonella sp.]MDY6356903.1 NADH-quinone oxidoreductase subunit C [Catonella sp.]
MSEVIPAKNEIIEIPKSELLVKAMEMKKAGMRLSQACAAYCNEKVELSYSFVNDRTYDLTTYRVITKVGEEIPSISEIVPAALFYENEMKELFGVNIKMISVDYDNKLYRIRQNAPMLPKEAREKLMSSGKEENNESKENEGSEING